MVGRRDFEAAYASGDAPWDIGAPQPEIVRLGEEGRIVGQVLDVGCGTGENALHVASLGRAVVGVDASPGAIARAQEKARQRGLEVPFLVHDALDLGALKHRFETVLDCGLFHVFDDADRKRYAASVAEAVAPAGFLHLLCFSDQEPPGQGPRRVTEYEIRAAFRGPFVVTEVREARFQSRLHTDGARAWLATLRRM